MRAYGSAEIRNVAVVGHGASGKTSLVDALCFASGTSKRRGSVTAGTALTDFTAEEAERGFSISLGCAAAEWEGCKVNLLDTPGYHDFQGDAIAGVAAADGVLLVVSAAGGGVEVGAEKMFREAVRRADPVLVAVTMMDKEHADFDATYRRLRERLSPKVVPVEVPLGEGFGLRGVMNLFTQKAYVYHEGGRAGEYDEVDVPPAARAAFDRYREALIEAVSATDDALLERYLEGGDIGRDEAIGGLKEAMKRGDLYPVFAVSAERMVGVRALLAELAQLMPSAYEMEELHAFTGAEGDATVEIHASDERPFAALVFKTYHEPHVGDVSYFRVLQGSVAAGQEVFNATRGAAEKLAHLAVPVGRDRIEVTRLHAGDVGCVAKLRNTHTNDTLSTREHPVRLPAIAFPEPVVHLAVHAEHRDAEEKLQQGLHRLHDEDPTFTVAYQPETHETVVGGMGERHLEVQLARLRRKYGVGATLTRPTVAYRETITASERAQGRHKKQTGGKGQFGDAWVRMAPLARGEGYRFEDRIVGGVIPSKFIPAVDKGIQEAAARGVLAGFPLVDFRVELVDGSYHSVDSSEQAFKMAGILAFRAGAAKCRPVLLEPLDVLEVTTPDEYLGDVLGELSGRRGQILGTERGEEGTRVRAMVPQAELHLFATQLFSLTHGRGGFVRRAGGYERVPGEVEQKVVAEYAKRREEALAG
ncbi:elongation factor G [Gemmatimonadetes bacterium T265]|nr:elongation factor G [Gemmatimonadetes bacterium T265]